MMDMSSSSSMAMSMTSGSSMNMASSTSSMAMDMGSATSSMAMSSSTSSSSMDMDMSMSMNTYLTTEYSGYPVIFKTLKASNGGAAFGIFCILFFTAFAFRGLSFLSAYVQQKVFKPHKRFDLSENNNAPANSINKGDINTSHTSDAESDPQEKASLKNRSALAKFLAVTPTSLYRDFIRLIIAFISAMLGYALMLAAMTFIIPYFFAIILGLSFGEVFFLRLASVMDVNQSASFCESLH